MINKIILILILTICNIILYSSNSISFRSSIYNPHNTKKYLVLNNVADTNQLKSIFPSIQIIEFKTIDLNNIVVSSKGNPNTNLALTYAVIKSTIPYSTFKANPNISYIAPYYHTSDTFGISNFFYVKVKNFCDTTSLKSLAIKYGFYIEAYHKDEPKWIVCRVDKNSSGNSLELSQFLAKEPIIEAYDPDFIDMIRYSCTNDPLFNRQWGLDSAFDINGEEFYESINMCKAWDSTTGNNSIRIAVFDAGISRNHPDLASLNKTLSYDCKTNSPVSNTNTQNFPYFDNSGIDSNSHGTSVAGIIGATRNNNLGISGIAPNCNLVDIAYDPNNDPLEFIKMAKGFKFAEDSNIAIINCSWISGSGAKSVLLENSIVSALTKGRKGLGCVITFAVGNRGFGAVSYPASFHPDIIAVGSVDPCGQLVGSTTCAPGFEFCNFGPEMDILAPGTRIPTTSIKRGTLANGFINDFNGSSSATPHVSAVAGLMLSRNPNLTQKEVSQILELTAYKLPYYTFSPYAGRLNGTFNTYCGYGMLNAHAALVEVSNRINPCPKLLVDNLVKVTLVAFVGCIVESTNTKIQAQKTIFDYKQECHLHNGFEVFNVAEFEVKTHP